jgi:hypothetical protein
VAESVEAGLIDSQSRIFVLTPVLLSLRQHFCSISTE